MAFSMGRFVRRFIDREPVVSFSIAISVFGLSMPFWVTPLREAAGLQVRAWVGRMYVCCVCRRQGGVVGCSSRFGKRTPPHPGIMMFHMLTCASHVDPCIL